MRLAVIPARGGSKRIPRKNIRPFAGRPMIDHAISVARESALFDRIVVSTDDPEIAEVARACGAELPFVRPPDLANDHAATGPVIVHAIDALAGQGWQATEVCCIYPCVPMLLADDLRRAQALLAAGNCGYVLPVLAFPSPVQRALLRAEDGSIRAMHPEFALTRTQDLPPAFHDAGQFCWGLASAWRAGQSPHLGARSVVLSAAQVVDIDTPDDWARAEALYQRLRQGRPGHGAA